MYNKETIRIIITTARTSGRHGVLAVDNAEAATTLVRVKCEKTQHGGASVFYNITLQTKKRKTPLSSIA